MKLATLSRFPQAWRYMLKCMRDATRESFRTSLFSLLLCFFGSRGRLLPKTDYRGKGRGHDRRLSFMICSNFRKSAWCYTVSSCYTVPKSAPFYAVACVADALNLLHIADYTKGLDECVGRLQRRLLCSRHK